MNHTKPHPRRRLSRLCAAVIAFLVTAAAASAGGPAKKSDMVLSLTAPEPTQFRFRVRDGITTIDYRNRRGILSSTQWPLIMRLQSRDAIGFVREFLTGQNREALVLRDPDGCLVLTSLIDDIEDLGRTAFDPACAGLAEDETYLEVQTEKYDTFELGDNSNTGNDSIRARLVDDDCSVPSGSRNVACLVNDRGRLQTVGPKTGELDLDGYGYGADDDASGMVIMMDVGGARVFDPLTFDLEPGKIRNMAGFINTVSEEILTGVNTTVITMTSHVLAGVAEPIAVFDFSVTDPRYAGYNALRRVDSGPVEPFNFVSPFPGDDNNATAEFNPFYDELLASYYPVEITLRAVAVAGEAPDFIEDLDQDGEYTAADVRLAGYTLVSNEIKTVLRLTNDNLLADSESPKCPPRTLLYGDLDGDMDAGAPERCLGTSSSTRTRRVPR